MNLYKEPTADLLFSHLRDWEGEIPVDGTYYFQTDSADAVTAAFTLTLTLTIRSGPPAARSRNGERNNPFECRERGGEVARYEVEFPRGSTTTLVKDTICPAVTYEYNLRGRAGQRVSIHLVTGQVGVSLYRDKNPRGDAILNNVTDWEGKLTEDGGYVIEVRPLSGASAFTMKITLL
jgi:hypothetical protein